MEFKEILKELRLNLAITQKKLALECNLSAQCINQLEAGTRNPTGSTLVALADFFDCSIDYLMGREPNLEDSIFSVVPASQLSDEEKELLKNFRKLPSGLKIRAQAYLSGMVEALTPEKKKMPGT